MHLFYRCVKCVMVHLQNKPFLFIRSVMHMFNLQQQNLSHATYLLTITITTAEQLTNLHQQHLHQLATNTESHPLIKAKLLEIIKIMELG